MPPELETDTTVSANSDTLNRDSTTASSVSTASIPSTDSTSETVEQVKRVASQIVDSLGEFPKYFGEFFQEYRRPLLALGLIFGAFISVKLTLAILEAINDVPVLAPLFELIGLIYSGWFIYRYLLKASNRSELASEMNALKDQILGRASQM
ncbi:MAG: CAAD domains of cyanobacterial aminoacyl-tRNA synthetase [Phormidesmis priestleyi Ana]|uniref:CAAD domains of cyanobacterial aminoacyl-tRNA synthetase n=1 Tax=Phormidesmis priestleyi Ana TaxID=1666911 RepID=A0A0P8BN87_9CYAN|nr:MAG: CAAD domains of cyanobacterial aminoacyl-tRNA synthetase [Phormidesmis priestleyi Ana]